MKILITALVALASCGSLFGQSPLNQNGCSGAPSTYVHTIGGCASPGTPTLPSGVLYATNYTGADGGAQIQACLNALPATGGTCDARGLTGAQSISTALNIPAYDVLILGDATYSSGLLPTVTWNNSSSIIGSAMFPNSTAAGTQFRYTGTGSAGSFMECATTSCFNVTVKDIYLRRTGTPAQDLAFGIDTLNTHSSLFQNVYISLFDYDWHVGGGTNGSYYNDFIHTQGQTGSTYGYYIGQNGNQNTFLHPTCNSGAVSTETCYYINAVNTVMSNPDAETSGAGIAGAFDIEGRSNTIYDPYIEGTYATPVKIGSSAAFNVILGGSGGSTITDNSQYWQNNVVINPGAQTTASPTASFVNYPNFWKAAIFKLGSTPSFLTAFGSGGSAAWTRFSSVTSLSRTSNVVTVTLSGAGFNPQPLVGDSIVIQNSSGGSTSFNGTFAIASVSSATSLTYNQTAADDTASGGAAVILNNLPTNLDLTRSTVTPTGTCSNGRLWVNINGGSNTTLYVCESGSWVAK